jgi:heme-degrading monooxygenase HmoA
MIVTIFRSRLRSETLAEYGPVAAQMEQLAASMPGFISVKSFAADDDEHVTIVEFASEKDQRAWREHAEHRIAQAAGRDRFYSEYKIQVCTPVRTREFEREMS